MTVPSYIASRADVDYSRDLKLREAYRGDPAGLAKAKERFYPLSLEGAVEELRSRGLDVTIDTIAFYCDVSKLRVIGRNYVLFPSDVDAVAAELVRDNRIGPLARRRRDFNISFREEFDAFREMMRRKVVQAAREIGVTEAEMWSGIRTGSFYPPDDARWNPEEARAWFAANRQNPDFLRDLKTQEAA